MQKLAEEIEKFYYLVNKIFMKKLILNHCIVLAGVNGSGKTTTAAKIAGKIELKKSVVLAASDTFRAAAVEQLKAWGKRVGAQVVSGEEGEIQLL